MFMVPQGFQEATCTLVGNSIGANHVSLAKRIWKITFMITFTIVLVDISLVYLFRRHIAETFT